MFQFLGGPDLNSAYYLFTSFGILAALAIAWQQWQRGDLFRGYRLTVTFGALAILRVFLALMALMTRSSPEILNTWAPPFERVVTVVSLGFLIWGFTPYFREKNFVGLTLLVANTAFAFIFYFLTALLWTGTDFNQSGWDIFFTLWQIILVIFGIVNCATKLDDEHAYALLGFAALLGGYLFHLFLAETYVQPHLPIGVRLGELVAYPLFVIATYQGTIHFLRARSRELQNLSQISLDQVKDLISLFEATREINASLDLSTVLDGAVQSVAQAIKADQCAIALPEDGEDMSQLRLVSIYNPSRKGRGESVTFPVNDQQAIKHALKRKHLVQIDEYQDNSQIRMLFTLMGAPDVGPLIIEPLLKDDEPIGVLMLGNAISKRPFTAGEIEWCKALADQISVAIKHANDYRLLQERTYIKPAQVQQISPNKFYSCFISYSSKDIAFAQHLRSDLQQNGVRCWFAPEDMKIGDKIRPRVEESIQTHDKLLLILSENSLNSFWVESEVEKTFEEERRRNQTVLFPVRLDETVMETDQAWAVEIRRSRHIGDFSRWKDYDAYQRTFERLLRDLKAEG